MRLSCALLIAISYFYAFSTLVTPLGLSWIQHQQLDTQKFEFYLIPAKTKVIPPIQIL